MTFVPRFAALGGEETSRRFTVLHEPADGRLPCGLVVHAPAFGEEMNKARRMVALQARQLADDGHLVLLVDPLGCGDSPGDFGDARWDIWVHDIASAMAWLRREFAKRWPGRTEPPFIFWGLRAGALLARAAAAELGLPCVLLLWQPATQGRQVLQQFLRLLSGGELVSGKTKGAAAAAREALASGQAVEVAGYRLAPGLAHGLEAALLEPLPVPSRMVALEVGNEGRPTPALAQALSRWQAAGAQVLGHAVAGPAFWQTTEIEDAPALISATRNALQAALGAPA